MQAIHHINELKQAAYSTYPQLSLPKIERLNLNQWQLFDNPENTPEIPSIDQKQGDILICDFQTAIEKYPDLFINYLGQALPLDDSSLSAYHLAHLSQGLFIYVPEGYHHHEKLEWTLDFSKQSHQYLLLVLGKRSQLSYLEKLINNTPSDFSQSYSLEIILEEGAQLDYQAIDQMKSHASNILTRRSLIKDRAIVNWTIGAFNEGNSLEDFDCKLSGLAAESYLNITAISNLSNHQVIDSKINNWGAHSIGHIKQYGAAIESGRLSMNGIGKIHKNAKLADAQQENRLLMLSDGARGDANPILLIDEFEVTAGHAASIAQVDQEQLWYLMSRGIPLIQAKFLVIRGFLMQSVSQIKDPTIRQLLLDQLDIKLQSLTKEGDHHGPA